MELRNRHILVVGLARTGEAVARFCMRRGARVTVTDAAGVDLLGTAAAELRRLGAAVELGSHRPESFTACDLIVVSPGVPLDIAPLQIARSHKKPLLGEIELAARFIREPIVAVTGTNGKTTTTELLGRMLSCSGRRVFVGGNIGDPLIGYVDREQRAEVVVAEISSFQLDTIATFRPHVGVLLNITPDHLDRYPDEEAYIRSKGRIFENQSASDWAVYNAEDRHIAEIVRNLRSRRLPFGHAPAGQGPPGEGGATIDGDSLRVTAPGCEGLQIDLSRSKLVGRHNRENIGAACLAGFCAGATPEGIAAAVADFKGLPHRLEYIASVDGVRFYNDSKATNVDAVRRALECFDQPLVLILGGRNKGGDFVPLQPALRRQLRHLVLMGECRAQLAEQLRDVAPQSLAATLEQAVVSARALAQPGDVVLLSPGCASFDMFTNYAERGEVFGRLVRQL
jgi:UDP-N-acetylmuramoylalanine--D-glutamate ligase